MTSRPTFASTRQPRRRRGVAGRGLRSVLALAVLAGLASLLAPAAASARADLGLLLAPVGACPHQTEVQARSALQIEAMRCLTDYARRRAGLKPLAAANGLDRAAGHKAADIIRCDEFSHEACGRPFTYWPEQLGYIAGRCWSAAENIAWGGGRLGSARAMFRAWLHSTGHRENILGPYSDLGVGLRSGSLEGQAGAHVWVEEFGSHGC
ncbi:MAG: hypothetical protein U0R71_02235 [Solirubrobacterales bacterium]